MDAVSNGRHRSAGGMRAGNANENGGRGRQRLTNLLALGFVMILPKDVEF
jgi:hypothetical protein